MENPIRLKKAGIVGKQNALVAPKSAAFRRLAGTAILGGALFGAGCDENHVTVNKTTVNNNYTVTGPDAGAPVDGAVAVPQGLDARAIDTSPSTQAIDTAPNAQGVDTAPSTQAIDAKADACVASGKLSSCSSGVVVAGILNQGESLNVGGYMVQLDDLEVNGSTIGAIVSVLDSCGNTLLKEVIAQGETKDMELDGQTMAVTVNQVAPGYTFGAKWADVSISVPCPSDAGATYLCSSVSGTINQGESLSVSGTKVTLVDFMVDNGATYALLNAYDANGNVIDNLKIQEGSSATVNTASGTCQVSVPTVAVGVTGKADWATVEISRVSSAPCQ